MKCLKLPRFMIAAPSSGSGKTTVTLAVIAALCARKKRIAAFKCGPDYIDPMFYAQAVGTSEPAYNLDQFFTDAGTIKAIFASHAESAELSVIEGVMGYFDGVGAVTEEASSYALADTLSCPVIMVLRAKGASLTLAALLRGLMSFRTPNRIAGVILNECSPMLYRTLAPMLQKECGISVCGFLPPLADCVFPSRHLGLHTAGEIADLSEKVRMLAENAEKYIALDTLLQLADAAEDIRCEPFSFASVGHPVIAVAADAAFNFTYGDNLALLQALGAKLVFFSPLHDARLPDCDGLYLCGGYPELYAKTLSENHEMLKDVRECVEGGLPTIAECGGFLYLHQFLTAADGHSYPMAGVIPASAEDSGRLVRFGYQTLTANRDNLLCRAGEQIRAHEFHHWDSTACGEGFHVRKPVSGREWESVFVSDTLYAGYPHLYFYANPRFAQAFVCACERYRKGKIERNGCL